MGSGRKNMYKRDSMIMNINHGNKNEEDNDDHMDNLVEKSMNRVILSARRNNYTNVYSNGISNNASKNFKDIIGKNDLNRSLPNSRKTIRNINYKKTGNNNNNGVDNTTGKDEITDGDSDNDDDNDDTDQDDEYDDDANDNGNNDLDLDLDFELYNNAKHSNIQFESNQRENGRQNTERQNEMTFSNDSENKSNKLRSMNKHGSKWENVEKKKKRSFNVLAINDEPSRKRTRLSYNCNIKENEESIEPNINNVVNHDCNETISNDVSVIISTNGQSSDLDDVNSVDGSLDKQSRERDGLSNDSSSVMTDILANMTGLTSIVPHAGANGSESENGGGNVNIINYHVNIVSCLYNQLHLFSLFSFNMIFFNFCSAVLVLMTQVRVELVPVSAGRLGSHGDESHCVVCYT